GEGAEGGLEAGGLVAVDPALRQGRVHGAVEHEPSGALGEEAGVGGSEVGAVGRSDVVQLPVAQGRAEHVHVPGGVGGGDVVEEFARAAFAAVGEPLVGGDQFLRLPFGVRGLVGLGVGVHL